MTHPDELKPCRWCHEPHVKLSSRGIDHYGICDVCGAAGPKRMTPEQAIEAWNTRTPEHHQLLEAVLKE